MGGGENYWKKLLLASGKPFGKPRDPVGGEGKNLGRASFQLQANRLEGPETPLGGESWKGLCLVSDKLFGRP